MYPEDRRDAQLALHQTRADYEQYAVGLPWSAEPMPGWESEKQPYASLRSGKADSPGYTAEQAATVAGFQEKLRRLSIQVTTHLSWATLDSGVVDARMALKHAHEIADEAA
ncbi:hypothetical protein ACFRCW_05010 [Streptomyces sp. NPDC056653]|uniref:hypothetical protein n=1 Tax=Streptomyces sp. NPDC056653 TaxID=3345894 RepID=UPI0036D0F6EB